PSILVADTGWVRRVDARGLEAPFPSGPKATPPSIDGVLAGYWNTGNLLPGLLLVGAGGVRFHAYAEDFAAGTGKERLLEPTHRYLSFPRPRLTDVTAKTGLPDAVVQGDHYGAWAADLDLDGFLDIILAPRKGAPLLLRNDGQGVFTAKPIFPGVEA